MVTYNLMSGWNNLNTSNLYKYYKKHYFYKIEKYFKIDQISIQTLQECVGYWFMADWEENLFFVLFLYLSGEQSRTNLSI